MSSRHDQAFPCSVVSAFDLFGRRMRTLMKNMKPIEALEISDLHAHAVWQYANVDGANETLVRPIKRLPVARLTGRVVGTQVRLANGTCLWAGIIQQ